MRKKLEMSRMDGRVLFAVCEWIRVFQVEAAVDLLLRACTLHALQANVREQRLVNARTSVPHEDSSRSFRRISVSGLRLTQKTEVSAWTFVEV